MVSGFISETFASTTFCSAGYQGSFLPQRQVQLREAKYDLHGDRRVKNMAA